MPFNGTGMFVRLRNWVADATAGIRIRADYHDIEDDGFAEGLSHCIARDGQSIIINNIPMNGKRLTGLQDPIDPQDAATRAHADTKIAKTGDATLTGNLTVTGSVAAGSTVTATGYQTRKGVPGPASNGFFNFEWTGNLMNVWINTTNLGALATQAFANTAAANAAAPKVNRAGDTMTGPLTVNGELVAAAAYLRFQYNGSPGYIQWNGGGSYGLGGGGTIWHTGNLSPVTSVRLVEAGNISAGNGFMQEAPSGAVLTGLAGTTVSSTLVAQAAHCRYVQYLTPAGWFTVGLA